MRKDIVACLNICTCTNMLQHHDVLYTYSHTSDIFMVVVHCTHLIGLTKSKDILILRAFYSADIGINTASSCESSTCFVPHELVAGSLHQLD